MNKDRTSTTLDKRIEAGFFSIVPDDINAWGCAVNSTLEKAGRDERFIFIIDGDSVVAEGIWTSEEAFRVAQGVTFANQDGKLHFKDGDYKYTGEFYDYSETFMTNAGIAKILINSGIFKRKQGVFAENVYEINYPETMDKGLTSVEMTSSPTPGVPGKENITLHFFL
jgi:hypothetical protein